MENLEDFLSNAKSYGTTPPYHKVEIVRNEIIYVPDREEYPVYWEQKDKEELEKCKLKCSYKYGRSRVMDCMKDRGTFLSLEGFSIIMGYPCEETISKIEEEFFEISRSELLVLTAYENITPFVCNQLTKTHPFKTPIPYAEGTLYHISQVTSLNENARFLCLEEYGSSIKRLIVPWMDYLKFLKESDFDIPQYTIPGY